MQNSNTLNTNVASPSPFHAGEQEIQTRLGKRDAMEAFGSRVIRPFLPEQHQQFFAQLPFLVVGGVDQSGWPWASILSGQPGFASSPDDTTLLMNAAPAPGDPIKGALQPGSSLGVLGVEITTRRRNRLNGRVKATGSSGIALSVDQSFGNCPQYIQTRSVDFVRSPNTHDDPVLPNSFSEFTTLDDASRAMIDAADTFFVSSYIPTGEHPEREGVDVSHKGGRPGFVKIDGNTLTIPDYAGNFHFNTLGNFLINPKAGLVFPDFRTGDLLLLTGTAEVLWEDDPDVQSFKGAERAWRFTLDHGKRLINALPFRSRFGDYSNNTLITGTWEEAARTRAAEEKRQTWRSFRVARIEDESSVIRSFYLEPTDGDGLAPFEAGQFLTLRITTEGNEKHVRTYTVSSAPGDPYYRISVKREPNGTVSTALHDTLIPGATIEAKAPSGEFYINASVSRPAVLLAGGVGVTPMISMAHHIAKEGLRTRNIRPLTIIHAAQTINQRAFSSEFRSLEQQTDGKIRYHSFISKPRRFDKESADFTGTGHVTADILRQLLALDDYDFYLCGPGHFMQGIYNSLRALGVRDARIQAEAFGPASLTRQADEGGSPSPQTEEAGQALIRFTKSKFEQAWVAGGETLLETAEAHGLTPEYGCRSGSCGSCRTPLKSGKITYRTTPAAAHGDSEVLICCAVPAEGSEMVEIDL